MVRDQLVAATTVVEIDDVHHAHAVIGETMHMFKELRMSRVAELLAALREHYVEIGRAVERDAWVSNGFERKPVD